MSASHTPGAPEAGVVGIDLGGTKIAAGVLAGVTLVSRVVLPTPQTGADDVVETLAEATRAATRAAGMKVKAVGLGVPGLLDYRRGMVKMAPNVAGMNNAPIRDSLQQAVGLPVYLENDANAAALAEHHLGGARGANSSFYMTVSTGIGGGFVLEGRVWRGANAQGAEVGHLTVLAGGPTCGCGLEGCLEALAAGRALEREAAHAYLRQVSIPELFTLWRTGDIRATSIVRQAARYVGIALASVVKLLDPEVIVLGGGIALGGGDCYVEAVKESYRRYLEGWTAPPVCGAQLGSEAGLVGAGLTALFGATAAEAPGWTAACTRPPGTSQGR